MRTRVAALYWLDQRGRVGTWFGGPGANGRPAGAVDVVVSERPTRRGDIVEGNQVPRDQDSYEAAKGKVLVIGMPVPQS